MAIEIGLEAKDRTAIGKILNRLLADETVLLIKTKNYHWNVVGPNFEELHKFFDGQYEKLAEFVDEVAERARSLGEKTTGTMTEYLQLATIKEIPGDFPAAKKMLDNLRKDHEQAIRNLRKDLQDCAEKFHDAGTGDFLTGLMEEHEKMAWMLRSYQE